ncbi:MAG TPA: hypothetical protein VGD91_12665 [Trebonia sp.]
MNISYLIYQAERPLGPAEQREADVQAGELAASVARLGRSLRHPATGAKGQAQRAARAAALASIPRPR